MLVNGRASVLHERMSDPARNAEIEAPGMPLNEDAWGKLSSFSMGGDLEYLFRQATARLVDGMDAEYAHHFLDCRDQWLALFQ